MKSQLHRLGLHFLLLAANSGWATEILPVPPAPDGTYSVPIKGIHKFTRNTDQLK